MGATCWRYFTPYQADPETALQDLRIRIFEQGEYVDHSGSLRTVIRKKADLLGQDPGSKFVRDVTAQGLRLQQAIEAGSTKQLPTAKRRLVERITAFQQFATLLGAAPPRKHEKPRSIDELLAQSGECGTHSILDIERVSSRPGFGVVSPLPRSQLKRLFHSESPTHEETESRWDDIAEPLSPWHARYLVVFDAGQPREYAFIGCSGD